MDDKLEKILKDWGTEILAEIEGAYRDVVVRGIAIRVVKEENYLLTLAVTGEFITADGTSRMITIDSWRDRLTQLEYPIIIDVAYLVSVPSYNTLPVRDIIEFMYRRCNGRNVVDGDLGNPWGPRVFREPGLGTQKR